MQSPSQHRSLLDTFINYCIRSKSYTNDVCSPNHSPVRYSRAPIHRKLKQKAKLAPKSIEIPSNLIKVRQKKISEEMKRKQMEKNRQLLNITPVTVYTSLESIKKQRVRANSTITINRKYLRAKTEAGFTQRSLSPFLTQEKAKNSNETHIQFYTSGEIQKNRPYTAFPSDNHSINRLRSIQIELPRQQKFGKEMGLFEESLCAWQTSFE